MARIIQYFLQGLLVVVPLAITSYVLIMSIQWIDNLLTVDIPGLGFLIILGSITVIGYLASSYITKKIFTLLERALGKMPIVNFLYTSLKDLIGAFVGDKKKFKKPVMVLLNKADEVYKIGFVTEENLDRIGHPGFVSVYLPHSYNFSGNHFVVPAGNVTPLDMNASDAMKYIISGGVISNE